MSSTDNAFYWISICYLVVLIISSGAAYWLWRLNDAFELGAKNRQARRQANMAVLSLAMIGAFASIVLFFLSQQANRESAEKVASAEEKAGKANERAANAEKQAADINLTIEKFRKGRMFTQASIDNIFDAVNKFPGTPFDIAVNQGDSEAEGLMLKIAAILIAAKWELKDYTGSWLQMEFSNGKKYGYISERGVVLYAHQSAREKFITPLNKLKSSLVESGIKTEINFEDWTNPDQSANRMDPDVIHVHVGRDVI